jgi:hypothetical protein
MNHDDALEMMAAERYTLGEMEPSERDAFEEHYFECTLCANDVRDLAKFREGVRTPEKRVKEPPAAHFNWWAAAASVFAAALGYQSLVVMPQMRAHDMPPMSARAAPTMRVMADSIPLESAPRSASNDVVITARRNEAVPFTMVIPDQNPYQVYVIEIFDRAGRRLASLPVRRPKPGYPVSLVADPGFLPNDKYTFVIRGGDREIARYTITMEVQ